MTESNEKVKKKKKFKIISPFRLVLLIVLIASNSFAWFIYATKISSEISIHVRSWNVVFEAGNTQVTNVVNFNVDNIYPGMFDYTYDVNIYNNSEVGALITYKILEARVLDTTYVTVEGRAERQEQTQPGDYTSDALMAKFENDFPFEITLDISSDTLSEEDGEETFTFMVHWPYESGDDALDTQWGVASYNYMQDHPSDPTIFIKVKIFITQVNENTPAPEPEPEPGP